jgi:hypothetical protein
MRLTNRGLVLLDCKVKISKHALSLLGYMAIDPSEDPREYGVYQGVALQPFHATYFAFLPSQVDGGYACLAAKAEAFRNKEGLDKWITWDNLKDQCVCLTEVPDPNKPVLSKCL